MKENILKGIIPPEKIATMKPEEMASDEMRKLRDALTKKAINEAQAPTTVGAKSDLFRCSRCGKRDTTYNQVFILIYGYVFNKYIFFNQSINQSIK